MSAIIFPGQGSQYLGMAKDFCDNFESSRKVIEEIEDSISINVRSIMFEDKDNLLNITNYTQICLFAASLSIFKAIDSIINIKDIGIDTMLGHSLGEYSSLVASNKLDVKECSKLLVLRGNLMNSALEPNYSGMAALIGLNCLKVEEIIKNEKLPIEIGNDNSHIQVVISGLNSDIDKCQNVFITNGVKKFIKLNVSAAFHSQHMIKAQNKLCEEIEKLELMNSDINIISNYDGILHKEINEIKHCLKNQMANRVRWTESILNLKKLNKNIIIEIGPGKVLSGLIKRIENTFEIISIDNVSDLSKIEKINYVKKQ
ncbi:MAG: hypothetical protein CMI96_01445 [Pelagibacteraceae bacterium]|nr:hypothetical protein [Pelagibacteraceae bacterium]|tara:strand:- start:17236 stop:18180 length:945 start_codon:yes stop_codon:yes gene_type:complete